MRGLFGKVFDKNLGVSKKENNEMDYEYRRMDRTIKNTGHKGKYCLQIQEMPVHFHHFARVTINFSSLTRKPKKRYTIPN